MEVVLFIDDRGVGERQINRDHKDEVETTKLIL